MTIFMFSEKLGKNHLCLFWEGAKNICSRFYFKIVNWFNSTEVSKGNAFTLHLLLENANTLPLFNSFE